MSFIFVACWLLDPLGFVTPVHYKWSFSLLSLVATCTANPQVLLYSLKISQFGNSPTETNRLHLSHFVSIFCLKMHELRFVDLLTINRKLLLSVFCTLALRISHEISQLIFTTIPWGGYDHYSDLIDEEAKGQPGHRDTKRKAGMWTKAFRHQNPCFLVTKLWSSDSPGDHCLCASMHLLSFNVTPHDEQLLLPRRLINIPRRNQWWSLGSSKDKQEWSPKPWATPKK